MHNPWVAAELPPSKIFSSPHVWKVLNDPPEDAPPTPFPGTQCPETQTTRRDRTIAKKKNARSSKPQRFNSTFEPSPSVSGDGDDDNLATRDCVLIQECFRQALLRRSRRVVVRESNTGEDDVCIIGQKVSLRLYNKPSLN